VDPSWNFDPLGLSFGQQLGGLGATPVPMRTPAPAGMDYGKPLTGPYTPPPGVRGAGAAPQGGKFGNFLGNFANLAEGLSGLGQLYIGLRGLGIAKDQLAFSREAYAKNLANQTKSYNTALEDRIRSRYVTEGRSSAEADAYLAKNNL